jgi:uncharacterized protein
MDPIILFFILGIVLGISKSEVRLPSQIYDFISIILLLSIGLKGGIELSKQPFSAMLPQIIIVVLIGFILPVLVFPILRYLGKFKRADAASIAAHYGSVSVGTFAVSLAYLNTREIYYEEYMALFVVILEIPAILIGIVLAKGLSKDTNWYKVGHEVFLGKGVALLVGGLLIGYVAGPSGVESIAPLFFDLFKGILALFLLEMGLITAAQLHSLKKYGFFLLGFGIIIPIIFGVFGVVVGQLMGLSIGGSTVFGSLTASASYIAVPAAMRISVPEANPTLSLTASLGITFPFNIMVGIPLYLFIANQSNSIIGG